jgi:hypothetical protein
MANIGRLLNADVLQEGVRVGAVLAVVNLGFTFVLPSIFDLLNLSDQEVANVVNVAAGAQIGSSMYAFLLGFGSVGLRTVLNF